MIDEKKLIEDIKAWERDIYDNEYDAKKFDFVFERIYEILEEQPQVNCTRREWYQRGYQDGMNADKWIPCEERLPSEYGQYLYTDKNDEVHEGTYCPPLQGMIRGWSTCEAEGFVKLSDEDVIAWQPLPAPYKKEGAENE